jgi:hypothetical protein
MRRLLRSGDPHARVAAWLSAGAGGEPTRDLALHASVCDGCHARMAAFDLLSAVDTGRAPLPPTRAGLPIPAATGAAAAGGGLAIAVLGIGLTLVIGVTGWRLLEETVLDGGSGASPQQAVLGAGGSSSAVASSDLSPGGTATDGAASASGTQTGSPSSPNPQPEVDSPVFGPPAPTATALPPRSTARPVATASPRAPTPSPSLVVATAQPTAQPTAVPTPEPPPPTPEPVDDCLDGEDNDGDLLVDDLDPGCIIGDDEADL